MVIASFGSDLFCSLSLARAFGLIKSYIPKLQCHFGALFLFTFLSIIAHSLMISAHSQYLLLALLLFSCVSPVKFLPPDPPFT